MNKRLLCMTIVLWLMVMIPESEVRAEVETMSYQYGQQMINWEGCTYVTGDDGIYRIDNENSFILIDEEGTSANGFFACGQYVYFMSIDSDGEESFLKVYDLASEETRVLCEAVGTSSLIGTDGEKVYYAQPSELKLSGSGYDDDDLFCYHMASGEKELIASGIGTAQFWNGALVITSAATDVRPVELMALDENGHIMMQEENCSQNFLTDGERLYYIRYHMVSDTSWDKAYICCYHLDDRTAEEIICLKGDYVTPCLYGMIEDYLVASVVPKDKTKYIQINTEDGTWNEMELPDGAVMMKIYYDEHGSRYYLANQSIYIWKGSQYEKIAELESNVFLLGISENVAYARRFTPGEQPKLCQFPISN